jgi:ketosteroid isomerase-like protein
MEKASSLLLITLAIWFTLGCNEKPAPTAADPDESAAAFDLATVRSLIMEKNARFTQAHITGDSAVLIDYFTPDARVLGPNAEAVVGQVAIAELNTQYVGYGIKEFTEVTTNFYGDENYLIDEGTYFMRYGEDVVEEGKYLNVWKQVDGEWRVCANMWNTNE